MFVHHRQGIPTLLFHTADNRKMPSVPGTAGGDWRTLKLVCTLLHLHLCTRLSNFYMLLGVICINCLHKAVFLRTFRGVSNFRSLRDGQAATDELCAIGNISSTYFKSYFRSSYFSAVENPALKIEIASRLCTPVCSEGIFGRMFASRCTGVINTTWHYTHLFGHAAHVNAGSTHSTRLDYCHLGVSRKHKGILRYIVT